MATIGQQISWFFEHIMSVFLMYINHCMVNDRVHQFEAIRPNTQGLMDSFSISKAQMLMRWLDIFIVMKVAPNLLQFRMYISDCFRQKESYEFDAKALMTMESYLLFRNCENCNFLRCQPVRFAFTLH